MIEKDVYIVYIYYNLSREIRCMVANDPCDSLLGNGESAREQLEQPVL